MKKASFVTGRKYVLLVVLGLVLLSSGCSSNVKYPPVRHTEIPVENHPNETYTLTEAVSASDLVAHVKVGNWLAEEDVATYYDASVVTTLKGKEIKNIILYQDGSSKGTFKGYPLFTYGNEMVLFLKELTGTNYNDAYWIIGAYTTIYDVVKDSDSGESYLIDRSHIMSESVVGLKNYASDEKLCKSLGKKLTKDDEVWSDTYHPVKYIFSLSEFSAFLSNPNNDQ